MVEDKKGPPCVPLPEPKTMAIPLPFGGELRSFVHSMDGPPDDCQLVQSLMLQIAPTLAGMTCVLKILKVIQSLKDLLDPVPMDPQKIPPLLTAIGDLTPCFLMTTPAGLAPLIAAILKMIIAYINCFLQAFESIYRFKVGIDLNSATGNPVLLASLNCADKNAERSMMGLNEALIAAQPVIDLVGMLGDIVSLPLELPSLADIAGEEDPMEGIRKLRDAIEQLQLAVEALPI